MLLVRFRRPFLVGIALFAHGLSLFPVPLAAAEPPPSAPSRPRPASAPGLPGAGASIGAAASLATLAREFDLKIETARTLLRDIAMRESGGRIVVEELGLIRASLDELRVAREEIDTRIGNTRSKLAAAGRLADVAALDGFGVDFRVFTDRLRNGLSTLAALPPGARTAQEARRLLAYLDTLPGHRVDSTPVSQQVLVPPSSGQGPVRSRRPLPWRPIEREYHAPSDLSLVLPAYRGGPSQPANDSDLAETPEIVFTPEVQALADALGNSPARIVAHVRDNFLFVPYFGSLKGSQATLETGQGNDSDLASLLLALLRYSGVPSRYVRGTVDIPAERINSWLGIRDADAANRILNTAGIDAQPYVDGGGEIVFYRVDRVWVEAQVAFSDYRGATGTGEAGMAWVPLDPAFKTHRYQAGIAGIPDLVPFDEDGYFAARTGLLAYEWYQNQVRAWLATNRPGASLGDIPYTGRINPPGLTILPASLPHTEVAFTAEFDEVPDSNRHKVQVTLKQGSSTLLDHTLTLVETALSRVTISYDDAGGTDMLADLLGGRDNVPEFLANVVPKLRVDGMVVASGTEISSGSTVSLTVGFIEPEDGLTDQVTHEGLTAGDYHALLLDLDQVSGSYLDRKAESLVAANADVGTPGEDADALEGELLHLSGLRYFARVREGNDAIADIYQYLTVNQVHEGLATGDTDVVYLYDRPFAVTPGNLVIDVKRFTKSFFGIDGDDSKSAEIFRVEGRNGSASEHAIWEEMVHIDSVSSIKSIQYANEIDINGDGSANHGDVLRFDAPGQTSQLCSGFPTSVKDSQEAALAAGQLVITPWCDHDYNDWHGIGWIEEDAGTGAGAYLISGGIAGGETTLVDRTDADIGLPIGPGWAARLEACAGAAGVEIIDLEGVRGLARLAGLALPLPLRRAIAVLLASGSHVEVSAGELLCGKIAGWLVRVDSIVDGRWRSYFHHTAGGAGTEDPPSEMGPDPGETGDPKDPCGQSGDPVNYSNGNLVEKDPDILIPLPGPDLALVRTYNSLRDDDGPLGPGWTHNHDVSLVEDPGVSITLYDEDGGENLFVDDDADGTYEGPPGSGEEITPSGSGWTRRLRTGTRMEFGSSGRPTSLIDRNGNQLTYGYSGGRLVSVTGLAARSLALDYNGEGRIETITDSTGRVWTYGYDPVGRLTTVTTPSDAETPVQTTSYTYYDNSFNLNNLASITRPDGARWDYTYYTNDKVHQTIEPEGRVSTLVYFPLRRETRLTDAADRSWKHFYDDYGRLISVIDPLGQETSSTWNADGFRDSHTDAAGATTYYSYDALGNLIELEDAEGGTTSYTYESQFYLITSMTNPRLKTTTFSRDLGTGDLLELISPGTGKTVYTYVATGQVETITDPEGGLTTFAYDANGYLDSITDAAGGVTEYDHDLLGRLVETRPPVGGPTHNTYDLLGRVLQVEGPTSELTTYEYDDADRPIRMMAPGNVVREYRYDGLGRLIEETDPFGSVTRYEWGSDDCGCGGESLTAVELPGGSRWQFGYDAIGNRVFQRDPLGREVRWEFDARGYETERFAGGETVGYEHDALGRLTRLTHPDASEETFEYDPAGNLHTTTGPSATLTFVYDDLNRITSRTDSRLGAKTISYEYDKLGNRTRMVDAEGGETIYTYDDAGRVETLRDPMLRTYSYHYDLGSRPTALDLPGGGRIDFGYDLASRSTSIIHRDDVDAVIGSFETAFDARSNPTTVTDPEGLHELSYDLLDRLISVSHPGRPDEAFAYDAVDNRAGDMSGRSFTYDEAMQLKLAGDTTYQYDDLGRLVSRKDGSGETTFTYDGADRLVRADLPDGRVVIYGYDPLGNRIEVDLDGDATLMVYDDLGISTRYEDSGSFRDRVVHDLQVDSPLALQTGGQAYDYRRDLTGSVWGLTDGSHSLRAETTYGAFGNIVDSDGDIPPIFTFTGREWAGEVGMYYVRARFMDPTVGRFNARDPMGLVGGRNPYLWALDSPYRYVDPTGELLFLLAAGAIVGAAASFAGYAIAQAAAGKEITLGGSLGAVAAGAIAGTVGVVAAPIAGAIGLSGGALGVVGVVGVNAAAGGVGYTAGWAVERAFDPCAKFSPLAFGTSVFLGGAFGAATSKWFPTRGMTSFNQAPYFFPRTARGVIPRALGGNAGKNAMNSIYRGGTISTFTGGLGPQAAVNAAEALP